MKHVCRYTIVRFMPYPETGEFANVGVVLMSPTAKFFGYKFIERVSRITAFFEELDANVFRRARRVYLNELERITQSVELAFAQSIHTNNINFPTFAFGELVKPREGLMTAIGDRVVMTDGDPREKLDEIFDHYVGRSFVTKAYLERDVEKRVHSILRAADLTGIYREQTLGGSDTYKARLPFVRTDSQGHAVRAIKPIFLGHDDPTRLYDHGWDWIGKIAKLRKDRTLHGDVLFAAEAPKNNFGASATAFAEISEQLRMHDIMLANTSDKQRILAFAEALPDLETSETD
ncbi:DUF3037 domain-containing protein [Burkholderia gladioli]|uniref:DUF3037 domain-containing protein n=1 Tax=Burkholderia gladioli TaxID=28095 RepID=A0AB38TM46_BURGA|nr:DUF3037 domain-containing protein [Burkholderia gladioli]KGE08512.1 hypothetical protein LA03_20455 [Burkholderia gladioli]MBU9154303.1 DUF3037 domain-containing protein [Burkholderia gladioli]MBU9169324.1 DUF3037 domain-containing protein [Burkholderia gladioli]MBU9686759.1 DUF3037 domain-containing protein [Burkholderia gladioli]UWX69453.1 DUF3037 domain-containing protein [Burkholderia gladioli]